MPRSTIWPRPPTEIIEAITTIDSDSIRVWFRPAMMVEVASGNCTRVSICRGVQPKARAASILSSGTWRMPRLVRRTKGGKANTMVTSTPGTLPMPNSITTGTR
ncbi:hypothetical protein D3C76_1693880 [compost metagenome]